MANLQAEREPIAIIGSGCRFPGDANTLSKLWKLLEQPRDVSEPIASERFNVDRFYHPTGSHHGTTNVKDAYFIPGNARKFDAPFFNVLPSEADSMDPQHRMLMEVCYEAAESAGVTMSDLSGSDTGVFIGLMSYDYSGIASRDPNFIPTYLSSGTANSNAAARISYHFDCHGPSMTIDTACSSSLVAVHQAVQVLRDGASRMAIAGGTNLILDSGNFIAGSKMNMLSPTGHSRMWDADADGYARGEGVGAVILKTLSSAIEDGDDIECIVRETGINQDGKTTGITMPSASAQAALIRSTYAKAGLDLTKKDNRCQYFEAHGTGTPAGDPQEAEALRNAFFGYGNEEPDEVLYVGSVKTVIGHTEGTAGIAGLLKASIALRHAVIPPNLLLNRLNPNVAPFYTNMRILQEPQAWPNIPANTPRRASVNSFGFGGTNAHAILESYDSIVAKPEHSIPCIPLVFSAASEKSLEGIIRSYLSYIKESPSIDLRHLAYTLSCRRSALVVKATFSALTTAELCSSIETRLELNSSGGSKIAGIRSTQNSGILGVFTGQGAQWAGMGATLVKAYPLAQKTIENLDQSLATLPVPDRPGWKILTELSSGEETTHLEEAIFSQTLCTAVQIVLADLLKSAGVLFKAVVGHSSGEIAAAYVAGFLTARDAIRIAYYRGYYAKLASGPEGLTGAMIAVSTTLEDGKAMCELEDFEGRISVAAHNSPESITISGDSDAIVEVLAVFEEEGKSARQLKVSTAYHSHHMLLCSESYVRAIKGCDIEILDPKDDGPTWYSSVDGGGRVEGGESLKGTYWAENMVNPVLFAQAVECAMEECGRFDAALEIGPHPALKRPVSQINQQLRVEMVPYSGVLNRGKDDLKSFLDSIGFIWSYCGGSAVDFNSFQKAHYTDSNYSVVLKDLPTYSWSHERDYWTECRGGKQYRTHETPIHEFLGRRTPDGMHNHWRWENVLSVRELPWLSGHALQGQTVLPATGYIALAMEAAGQMASGRPVRLIELTDLVISKAIAIDDDTGTEVAVTMSNIAESKESSITAMYTCYSTVSRSSGTMAVSATAEVEVFIGETTADCLPDPVKPDLAMADIDVDTFYESLTELGYGYSGDFRAMSNLTRRLGVATGTILPPAEDHAVSKLPFYPSMLDTALQGMFAAFSAPNDGRLWTLHAPTGIQRVSLVPSLCVENMPNPVSFICTVSASSPNNITGDISVYSAEGNQTFIEIEGLVCRPFSQATQADDCHLFSDTVWNVASPNGDILLGNNRASPSQLNKAYDCERVALYYMRSLSESISETERAALEIPQHHEALFESITRVIELVSSGKHVYASKEWLSDTHEQILSIMEPYGSDADFNIMRAVGENLPAVVRGETTILEHMTKDSRLDEYYVDALGFEHAYDVATGMVAQFVHRYPHMDIIEIGGGTGGATAPILSEIGTAFSSYTFTDIGVGFLLKAQEMFKDKDYANKMIFKPLDIEKDVTSQGFVAHSYDVVLAANVLHATHKLEETLKNARKLLKPGGYLVMLEIVDNRPLRVGLVFGGLPGWWVGREDGRRYAPTIELTQWNKILKKTGFSGIDTFTPLDDPLVYLASVFVSQAVDETILTIRRPLSSRVDRIPIANLLIIGGDSMESSRLIEEAEQLLRGRSQHVITATTLDELQGIEVPSMCTVLSLTEIDGPMFKTMSKDQWQILKNIFTAARNVLWLTRGYRCQDPYAAMTVGFMRCITYELPQLRTQLLDIDQSKVVNGTILAEMLLRLHIAEELETADQKDSLVWTAETEVVVENELLIIPRMKPQIFQNKRYNSARRPITKLSDLESCPITLEWLDVNYILRERPDILRHQDDTSTLIDVHSSLLCALPVPAGRLFFNIGVDKVTGKTQFSASLSNASTISIPKYWTVPIEIPHGSEAQFLTEIVDYVFNETLGTIIPAGGTLLIHEPNEGIFHIFSRSKSYRTVFTTCTKDKGQRWTYIHPQSSSRMIKSKLPTGISLFLDLSSDTSLKSVALKISATLPQLCQRVDISTIVSKEALALHTSTVSDTSVPSILHHASSIALSLVSGTNVPAASSLPEVSVTDISLSDRLDLFSIVNWRVERTITTLLEPVDARKNIFQRDKTYWLVGLAGDLGQSLCDWMVDHGARYFVLMSRTKRVEENWIRKHKANDVTILFLVGDVTIREDVRKVHQHICSELPAIAGVANGALVLQDQAFEGMDLETFQKVVKPKIDGTLFLSELFEENTLEFFIAFSSVVATLGNSGQSAYSAANSFSKALINQRRERGLAGSVIDLSRIAGVGYVDREVKSLKMSEKQLKRLMNVSMPMSEPDLHQVFAEAIVSGRPDSGLKSELISGIRTLTIEEDSRVYWAAQVKFSHFVRIQEQVGDEKGSKVTRIPVRKLLQAAKSPEQVLTILRNAFIAKLNASLNLSSDDSIDGNTPLIELGLDSLVAVDVRTWFLQELKVDLPVLKILGGASAMDLVSFAAEKLPQEIMPKFGEGVKFEAVSYPDDAPTPAAVQASHVKQPKPNEYEKVPIIVKAVSLDHAESPTASTTGSKSSPSASSTSTVDDAPPTPPSEPDTRAQDVKLEEIQAEANIEDSDILREEPMSYEQSSFWFLGKYLEDPTAFNITFWVEVKGNIDASRLERAVDLVAQGHESLRTTFSTNETGPCQQIMRTSKFRLTQHPVKDRNEFLEVFTSLKNHVYDIENGDTIKLVLCEQSENLFYFALGFHHILMDGTSTNVLFANLQQAYKDGVFPAPQLQYPAWAVKQRSYVESSESSEDRAYWSREFATIPPSLPLFPMSSQSSRKILKRYHMLRSSANLGLDMTARIKERCRSLKVSPAYFHLAVYKTLLFRFLNTDHICIGINDMNRTDTKDAGVIGNLMNILPVQFKYNPTQNFLHAIKEARAKAMTALVHAKVPFDVILGDLNIARDPTRSPVFQASFDYRETFEKSFLDHETYSPPEGLNRNSNGYDVSLGALESLEGESTIYIGAQSSLYTMDDAEIILKTYVHLLETFTEKPATRVDRPSLHAKADIERGFALGLGAPIITTWPETLVHRIEEMISTRGTSIALKDGYGGTLTYAEMGLRIGNIAASLPPIGKLRPSPRIGIFQRPSVDWICSMLAILRIGAVCLPLESRNGLPRLAAIVKTSCPAVVLVDSTTIEDAKVLGHEESATINVSELEDTSSPVIPIVAKPEEAALILFTSGSTGVPKGIVLKHSSIVNVIESLTQQYGLKNQVVLQHTAYSFDMSVDEIFIGLGSGGSLFIVDTDRRGDSRALMGLIASEGVTYTRTTPSGYLSWIRNGADLLVGNHTWKHAFAGGDKMADSLRQAFRSLGLSKLLLYQSYGPSEISVTAIKGLVDYQNVTSSDENIPLGKPLHGYSIYILDSNRDPVPPGVPGEIFIGGAGVSLGYLNDSALTAEKFMDNPFAPPEYTAHGWTRMYRSGDKARMTSNGDLLFHGRIEGDLQIKTAGGIRIELQDVENSILQASQGALVDIVCTVRGDPQFIVAHAVFSPSFASGTEDRSRFINDLLAKLPLPSYMVPATIIPLDTMPLTVHMKRDRTAIASLPVTQSSVLEQAESQDLAPLESEMRAIWVSVLPLEMSKGVCTRDADFFRFGGSSLLMIELQSYIRRSFGVSLSLQDLFEASTLGDMTRKVQLLVENV
ncbi:hypothetical protein BKA65DRAFT_243259 [Rhexocercosporidium sp. MPI-PUGE-AT-0058]|nr:hypothetical protein BKA65DRAFT_243259 [Rhexocercosporidium sp. MPI-PUGE-AT-0058]